MASPQEPDPDSESLANVSRSSFFTRGVLFELMGTCLVPLASSYSALGPVPAMRHLLQAQPGDRSALLAFSAQATGLVLRWPHAHCD